MGLRPLALWRAGPLAPPPPPVEETHRLTGYLSADQAGRTALALSPPRFRPIAADSSPPPHTHTRTRCLAARRDPGVPYVYVSGSAWPAFPAPRRQARPPSPPNPLRRRPAESNALSEPADTNRRARQGAVSPGRPNVSEPRAWPKVSEPRA